MRQSIFDTIATQFLKLINMKPIVVLDFETTGMSPNFNDRAIEIGAVKIINNELADEFQSLMNPGVYINSFIESLTGISNKMVADAPENNKVMQSFHDFIQGCDVVAHNLSFDMKFLEAEFEYINLKFTEQSACSLLLSRRMVQNSPNHKLGTLVNYLDIPKSGQFHRALDDAKMTAYIWIELTNRIEQRIQKKVDFNLIQKICKTPKKKVDDFLKKQAKQN